MSKYQCLVCTKDFKQKSQLDYHKNRKNKCEPAIEQPTQKTTISPHKIAVEQEKPAKKPQKSIIIPQKPAILTEISPNPTQNPKTTKNEPIPLQNENLIEKFPCEHCTKSFARKDILTRHVKSFCPVIKQQNKEKQIIFDKLLLLETKNKQLE